MAVSADVSAGDTILASQQTDLRDDIIDQVTSKGDLMVGTTTDTMEKLTVGTNDDVLIADSAESGGIKWGQSPLGVSAIMARGAAQLGMEVIA